MSAEIIQLPVARQESDIPSEHAVLRLPIAPRANSKSRFSAMEITSTPVMLPEQALQCLQDYVEKGVLVERVELSGPGDPLVTIDVTLTTAKLIKSQYPDLALSVKTLGINGEKYADQLGHVGINHIELTIDAVDTDIMKKLYAWVRPGFKTLPLPEAVEVLKAEQEKAIRAFKDADMAVTALTTLYPDNNIDHVEKMALLLAKMGVDEMILIPHISPENAEIILDPVDPKVIQEVSSNVAKYLTVEVQYKDINAIKADSKTTSLPKPTKERPNVAVVSSTGMEVDLHLGHAIQVLVYGPREDGLVCLLEVRPAPEPGGGSERWEELASTLTDCFVLLAASAGDKPRKMLSKNGLQVYITNENIDGTVEVLYGLDKKKRKAQN